MLMNFKAVSRLKKFKIKVDRELKKILGKKLRESGKISPEGRDLVQAIKDFILRGGKRLRPALVYFAYQACGGRNEEAVIYTSQAIEFLHTFALIHDDIIDRSFLRRGGPTVNKILGNERAIWVGDLAMVFADEIFTSSPFKDKIIREARKVYNLLREEVVFGEYMDIIEGGKKEFNEKKIMKILEYKSGKYTIERPLHLGAALAEANKEAFAVLSRYGVPLGIAFQIKDDILGMFGKEKEVGKPVDSDLKEGKKTLLIAKAVERLKGKRKGKLLSLLGNQNVNAADLQWVRRVIEETGSLDYSQKLAQKLIREAKEAMAGSRFKKEGKEFLLGIADYILERSY